jgi:hypothetical protein
MSKLQKDEFAMTLPTSMKRRKSGLGRLRLGVKLGRKSGPLSERGHARDHGLVSRAQAR